MIDSDLILTSCRKLHLLAQLLGIERESGEDACDILGRMREELELLGELIHEAKGVDDATAKTTATG